ncbi:MAG: hypothetical protein PVJ57_02285 [Phycisphaerae bacterium]
MKPRTALVVTLAGLFGGLGACDGQSAGAGGTPLLVFGRTGVGPGEFTYPRAGVAATDGRFYVVDKAARIQCYTGEGEFVLEWRMPESQAGKPTGLGIDAAGTVYAADTHYARVVVFDAEGRELARFGTFGEGPGQFRLPTDVAVDRQGAIYVSEYGGNDRISKFSPDREYLFSFGGPDAGEATLRRPQSLVFDNDGTLWVTDAGNHRVCHFDADGRFLGSFGTPGDGVGELRFPYGLDFLSDGTLVVTEFGNNRLQRFDRQGHSLGTWGSAGRKPGELAYPWAAVVVPEDRIVIVDSGNNRMQVIAGGRADTWRLATSPDE